MTPHTQSHKVGILPFTMRNGVREYLIHLPKAKNLGEQEQMKWGLIRGTAQDTKGKDISSLEALHSLTPSAIELPIETAMRELEEEAGISPADYDPQRMIDLGLFTYASTNRPAYPIHFFAIEIPKAPLSSFKEKAVDAVDLAFRKLVDIETLTSEGTFKKGYVTIVKAIDTALNNAG